MRTATRNLVYRQAPDISCLYFPAGAPRKMASNTCTRFRFQSYHVQILTAHGIVGTRHYRTRAKLPERHLALTMAHATARKPIVVGCGFTSRRYYEYMHVRSRSLSTLVPSRPGPSLRHFARGPGTHSLCCPFVTRPRCRMASPGQNLLSIVESRVQDMCLHLFIFRLTEAAFVSFHQTRVCPWWLS